MAKVFRSVIQAPSRTHAELILGSFSSLFLDKLDLNQKMPRLLLLRNFFNSGL